MRSREARSPRGSRAKSAQVVEALADADVAGDRAGDRRLDGGLDVLGRQAEPRGAAGAALGRAPGRPAGTRIVSAGPGDDDAVEDVLDALDAAAGSAAASRAFSWSSAWFSPKIRMSIGCGTPPVRSPMLSSSSCPKSVWSAGAIAAARARMSAMTSSTSAPLAPRLQPDDVVAAVRLGDEEAELRAGAARVAADVGDRHDDLLEAVEHRVRVGERGAGRRPVVEDDRALVHRRAESR